MAKSKIYTKTGDSGQTSLHGGERVQKNSPRVAAYGSVDELNSALGLAAAFSKSKVQKILLSVQNELFNIGAELANPKKLKATDGRVYFLEEEQVLQLEKLIDEFDIKLKPLHEFILPGGSKESALLHQARTICRRAEREVVKLSEKEKVNPTVMKYLNRLSDLLFVLARVSNNGKDILWKK